MSLAITYRRSGDPTEILEVTDVGEPRPPERGQLQVRVSAFPIHPGDLMAISASQTPGRELIAGIEATGVVTEVGAGVTGFGPGTRVSFFPHQGAWRQVANVDAAIAVPVPDPVPDEVAAQMLCNPITALMLRRAAQQHFGVGFDAVVLNNAAASSVGRLFTAIAEDHQIATISIVRSEQRAQQLRDRFPTVPVVSTSDRGWGEQVRTAAAGRPISVALDPVGGATAGDLLHALSPGGTLIIYGDLTQEPIPLHAATVLHSALAIRGLTINRWLTALSPEQRASDVASAVTITTGLPQHFDVAAVYPLDRIADAVRDVTQPGKVGTVVVKA
ncbi:MAG: dehydrogenase [Mycobacterium sp.]|jgi:NADPH:quinone reductase-like Zn-dependent oxidoreductase|uniref:alcohol dehydrogenase catalytic domain-containing protein n=1 Tax=Mycobacterium sp. TaxID=1785 RepID=UPI00261E5E20|nr:zinc-binding dehydrogenase [Mycobacterium sp.]MCW2664389.1 dehydrogenase [Mycobacterium sp.]